VRCSPLADVLIQSRRWQTRRLIFVNKYAGTYSQFDRSKYKTEDRRILGPKFDEYSPHLPQKSDVEKLPLEYRCDPGTCDSFLVALCAV
jgi:hypothetical protein